ncbi:DUF4260 family protein [Streptomyces beijiangensis]|uniref:DUF4260 family protein n=1 Tax=Streptomyces beijiangensis TaxID=163361 RepID=A0A939JKI2_9ACTN|nr:DUF4260 family protein [Streptomyces beijiangensis]MBO0514699.1 DUF4260 family protein [Streptomyces beijiangensis]
MRTATTTTATTTTTTTTVLTMTRRSAWLVNALFWSAFAVLEAVNHGWIAGLFALAFFIAPDLTMLIGAADSSRLSHGQLAPRAVPFYNAAHRALVPIALMAVYTYTPITWAPIFAALCGWTAHISYDRALGYGLRSKEGFQRA